MGYKPLCINLDEELHTDLKILATAKRTSMKALIVEALEKYMLEEDVVQAITDKVISIKQVKNDVS